MSSLCDPSLAAIRVPYFDAVSMSLLCFKGWECASVGLLCDLGLGHAYVFKNVWEVMVALIPCWLIWTRMPWFVECLG